MANGVYSTSTNPTLQSRKVYLRDKIYQNADLSPLYFLLHKRGRVVKETHKKFEFVTVEFPTMKFQIENVDNTATSITVKTSETSIKYIRPGDIIRGLYTGEQMRVTNVTGKVLTVIRAYGEKNTAVAVTGAYNNLFVNMGAAFEEGSESPMGSVIPRGEDYNYCQTFRKKLKITRNKMREGGYDDNGKTSEQRRVNERYRILKEHQNDIEKTLLFGVRQKQLVNDEWLYVTGGVFSTVKTNVLNITNSSQFTVGTIDSLIGKMSDAGFGAGNNKVLMFGSEFNSKLNDNVIKVFGGSTGTVIKEFGLSINRVYTSYGQVDFIYNPVLSSLYPNSAIILDLDTIYLHVIDESQLVTNEQEKGFDGAIDNYLTDCGIEINNEAANGIIHLNF